MADTTFLSLNFRDEFYRVDISKIVFFEANGNYTNFYLSNGQKDMVGMNLAQMMRVLMERLRGEETPFMRVGKRHIVNRNYIYHIEVLKQKLMLSDGENFFFQLSVSRDALKRLKEWCTEAEPMTTAQG